MFAPALPLLAALPLALLPHIVLCDTQAKTLDFSVDSNVLQSGDTAGELLLWAVESKTQAQSLSSFYYLVLFRTPPTSLSGYASVCACQSLTVSLI